MSTLNHPYNLGVHPQKFAMWLGIGAMTMSFAGLTSAFIVRKAQGNWVNFPLPDIFWISTAIVAASSLIIHLAFRAYKKQDFRQFNMMMFITILLGIAFLFTQWTGWQQMTKMGILLDGNPSGSFVYIISGLHLAHIVGGIVALTYFLSKTSLRQRKKQWVDNVLESIDNERMVGMELVTTFWHFVGILWIYLFFFFKFY